MADMKQISEDVTRTWALVAAQPLEPVGVAFFLKIFEIAPEALRVHTRVQPLAEANHLANHLANQLANHLAEAGR